MNIFKLGVFQQYWGYYTEPTMTYEVLRAGTLILVITGLIYTMIRDTDTKYVKIKYVNRGVFCILIFHILITAYPMFVSMNLDKFYSSEDRNYVLDDVQSIHATDMIEKLETKDYGNTNMPNRDIVFNECENDKGLKLSNVIVSVPMSKIYLSEGNFSGLVCTKYTLRKQIPLMDSEKTITLVKEIKCTRGKS